MKWEDKTTLPGSVGVVPVNNRQQWFLEQLASVGGGFGGIVKRAWHYRGSSARNVVVSSIITG